VLATLRRRLAALLEQRKGLAAERDQIASVTETRDATPEETAAFNEKRAAIKAIDDEIGPLTNQIRELEADAEREQAAAAAYAQTGLAGQRNEPANNRPVGGAQIISEPRAYGRDQRHSYFLDLARDQLGRGDGDGGVQAARERLRRHAQELSVEMPKREANRRSAAQRALEGIEGLRPEHRSSVFERGNAQEMRVNPNRTDGTGGYFVQVAAVAA
jgi:hypothetical protein